MGGAPYIGPKLGMGRYLRYQYRVYTRKSAQVSYPHKLHNLNSSTATIDFSLIQTRLPIQSKGGRDISPCVVECRRIQWAWLQSLAVYDCLFVMKVGIKLTRLSFTAV